MIPAVPSNAVFCSISTGITVLIFSKNPSSLFDIVPRAPTTIGMASISFNVHILDISMFKSWYFKFFSILSYYYCNIIIIIIIVIIIIIIKIFI